MRTADLPKPKGLKGKDIVVQDRHARHTTVTIRRQRHWKQHFPSPQQWRGSEKVRLATQVGNHVGGEEVAGPPWRDAHA